MAINDSLDNRTGVLDEDNEPSDWIEIYNPTDAAVNLDGLYLTDDDADLTKWQFPAIELGADSYLVVFASGKDRVDPASELHTNFKLSGDGEYLGLVMPSGNTVIHDYAPQYPQQFSNISYGLAPDTTVTTYLAAGSEVSYLIPTADDAALGTSWTELDFDDSSWKTTVETPSSSILVTEANTGFPDDYLEIQNVSEQAVDTSGWFVAVSGGNDNINDVNPLVWELPDSIAPGDVLYKTDNVDDNYWGTDIDWGRFSNRGWVMIVDDEGSMVDIMFWGYDASDIDRFFVTVQGNTLFLSDDWSRAGIPSGGRSAESYQRIGNLDSNTSSDLTIAAQSKGEANADLVTPFPPIAVPAVTGIGFDQEDPFNLAGEIESNLAGELHSVNSSAYFRIEFEFDPEKEIAPEELFLNMKYDDGFIAYLNGVEVARRSAPVDASWDAAADSERDDADAVVSEEIDISAFLDQFLVGQNVLAIHGLNIDAADEDFLIVPELKGPTVEIVADRYFSKATDGKINSNLFFGAVKDTKFSVNRGFFTEPFSLEISTETEDAQIRYTLDGSEPSGDNGILYRGPLTINSTTIVRAFAFKTGFQSTNVDSQTYLFLDDVIRQSPNGQAPPGWPSGNVSGQTLNYGMDPAIVDSPVWGPQMIDSLLSIPTISMSTDLDNLMHPTTGIYTHAGSRGRAWERPGSIELINPDGSEGFQVSAGLRIRGGFSRSGGNPKHAFRLFFRGEYGDSKLEFPLFENEGVDEFDSVDLRTSQNYSWGFQNSSQNTMVRDIWSRDVQLELGSPSTRSRYYHLYINGQYWGVFQTEERPEADFASSYFGGNPEDYDVVKVNTPAGRTVEATDGNLDLYNDLWQQAIDARADGVVTDAEINRMKGLNDDGTPNSRAPNLLDVRNLMDYMIITYFTADKDGPASTFTRPAPNNFFAIINRENPDGFKYIEHDSEHSLDTGGNDMVTNFTDGGAQQRYFNPHWLHDQLMTNDEYRIEFGDRVQELFYNGGIMTAEEAIKRIDFRANQVDSAMIAESARWGSSSLNHSTWETAVQRVRDWIENRVEIVIDQLQRVNYFNIRGAATFSINRQVTTGGVIDPGDTIKLDVFSPRGTKIYYTLDGSDPRLPGGAVNPNAILTTGDVDLTESALVTVRVASNNDWTAISRAQFFLDTPASADNLAVSELHFNPPGPSSSESAAGFDSGELFEFVELVNTSDGPINLAGSQFTDGISFAFDNSANSKLAPGERVVVVSNRAAFEARYGTNVKIAGEYAGNLRNNGEQLILLAADGQVITDFEYNDGGSFPGRADGSGSSLEVLDTAGNYNLGSNWRSSSEFGGSPGTAGSGARSDIVINEVLTHTDLPQKDAIELHNTTAQAIDIGGWVLSDSDANYKKYVIPQGTVIDAGGFVLFDEDQFNAGAPDDDPNAFALSSSHGDDVWLLEADSEGNLISFADHVEFGAAHNGVSLGRWPDASGSLFPMTQFTPSAANSGPQLGSVIISELVYDALSAGDDDDLEYVELYNTTSQPIDLSDWRIRKGIDLNFDSGTTIDAGAVLVVLSFNPDKQENADRVTAFRDHYGIDDSVALIGGFAGKLDDGGDRVQLQTFDAPPIDEPDFTPHPLVDEVRYDDMAPWPTEADGGGKSLTRNATDAFGNLAGSWTAADPTPGSVSFDPPMQTTSITQVLVGSREWDAGFVHAGGVEAGDLPLPWSNLDQLSLVFSGDINVSQSDLTVIGTDGGGFNIESFDYDSATRTATWTLPLVLGSEKLLLDLASTVTDAAGEPLSGDLQHRIDILPGDVTQSGIVDNRDVQAVRDALLSNTGDVDYSALADLNGSGSVDIRDVQPLRVNLLSELPPGEPAAGLGLAQELAELDSNESAYLWSSSRAAERRVDAASALMDDEKSTASETSIGRDSAEDWSSAVDATLEDPDAWA